MTKTVGAAAQKKREKEYHGALRFYVSSAHRSGPCVCRSMVGSDGGIKDAVTYVVEVPTPSMPVRTVFCETCVEYTIARLANLRSEEMNGSIDNTI